MAKHIKTPRAKQQIRAKELERMAELVQKHDRRILFSGIGHGLEGHHDAGGGHSWINNNYVPFWAKITANDGGSPRKYSFTEQQQNTEGTFIDAAYPRSGDYSTTPTTYPAYEVNAQLVPNDTIVKMWLGYSGLYYLFSYFPGLTFTATDVTWAANQNNYAAPTNYIRALVTTSMALTGVVAPSGSTQTILKIENRPDSTGSIEIPHQSGSSSAANRFYNASTVSIIIRPGEEAWFGYDPHASVSRWICTQLIACQGGVNEQTGDYTFVLADWNKEVRANLSGNVDWTLPTTPILPNGWFTHIYNDAVNSATDSTIRLVYPAATDFGFILSGGGGVIFSDGTGYFGYPTDPHKARKTVSAASYTVLAGDAGLNVYFTVAGTCAVTLPQSTSTGGFPLSWYTRLITSDSTQLTITPTISTIDGETSLTVPRNSGVELAADGTNYSSLRGRQPEGVITMTGASPTLTVGPSHFGKWIVFTGTGTAVISEVGSVPTGMDVCYLNVSSSSDGLLRVDRLAGGSEYLAQYDAYHHHYPDYDDTATLGYGAAGFTRFGVTSDTPLNADRTLSRADKGRILTFAPTVDRTLTLFQPVAGFSDNIFAVCVRNLGTANVIINRNARNIDNAASNITIGPCTARWLFSDGTNWWTATGDICFLTTNGDIVAHTGTIPTRLAVGTNDYNLVADSTTATGLKYTPGAGYAHASIGSGSQSLSAATAAKLTMGTTTYNTGMTVTVTDELKVITAGKYSCKVGVHGSYDAAPSATTGLNIIVSINGATTGPGGAIHATSTNDWFLTGAGDLNLAVNDLISLYADNKDAARAISFGAVYVNAYLIHT